MLLEQRLGRVLVFAVVSSAGQRLLLPHPGLGLARVSKVLMRLQTSGLYFKILFSILFRYWCQYPAPGSGSYAQKCAVNIKIIMAGGVCIHNPNSDPVFFFQFNHLGLADISKTSVELNIY